MAKELGPTVQVSDVESTLPAPSYTVDTLRHLAQTFPEHTFHLVIGADIMEQTQGWKSWDVIVREYCPIIVGREGYADRGSLHSNSPIFPAVSSTEVRRRLVNGESVDDLVPASVSAVLKEHNPWHP